MIRLMIKYTIKENKISSFQKAIESFVEAVQEKEKDILEYNVFQGPDGLSFVHYISFTDEESQMSHVKSSHAKKFNKILNAYTESTPLYIPLNETGQAQTFVPDTSKNEKQEALDTSLYQKHPEMHT